MNFINSLKIKSKLALTAFLVLLGLYLFRDNPPDSLIPQLCIISFAVLYFCVKRDLQDRDKTEL